MSTDEPSAARAVRRTGDTGSTGAAAEAVEGDGSDVRRRSLLSFAAFDASHHRLWLRYAHTQVGGRAAAEQVVEDACRHLLEHWPHALRQRSLTEYAWTVLKEHVARWLRDRGREPQLPGTAAFEAAVRKVLPAELRDEFPDEFAVLEGELLLYAAIARLPERQYDVVVLRYVLGCTDEEVAGYLGCDVAAVHSHLRHAKRRLARELRPVGGAGAADGGPGPAGERHEGREGTES